MILMLSAASRADHVLDAGVQVLGVLADDDQVDVFVAGLDATHRLGGPQVGVQAERLAEPDIDAPEPGTDRRRDRTLQPDPGPSHGFEDVVRKRRPVLLDRGLAGHHRLPFEADAGRIEHAGGRLRQLRPDAVAGDQGDSVGHGPIVATHADRRWPASRREPAQLDQGISIIPRRSTRRSVRGCRWRSPIAPRCRLRV